MTRTIGNATLWVTTAFMVAALFIIGLYRFGDEVESRLFPIYDDVTLTYIIRNEETADILFTGNKGRSCLFRAINAEVLNDGEWRRANSVVLDRKEQVMSADQQRIAVGASFVRFLRVNPPGDSIRLRLESTCHPLWTSYQDMPAITAQVSQDNSGVAQR